MLALRTAHLKAALTHAAKGDIRYYLNGVLIERTATGEVHIVATDGHRAFIGLVPDADCDQVGPWSIIIPADAVKQACTVKTHAVQLTPQGDGRYALGSVLFTAVAGCFPDWRRVKPDTTKAVAPDMQFNWEYVADADKALRLWYGSKAHYWLKSLDSGQGCMLGSDSTACVVIMPVRSDTITCATPFTPAPYGA